MKNKLVCLIAASLILLGGCSFLGGSNAGTVDALWADVPKMDGLTNAKLDLPLAARLGIQAVFQGRFDFIAFTTTKTPKDAQAFYTKERMATTGWKSDAGGCLGDTSGGSVGASAASQGAVCFFNKKEGAKDLGLAIFINVDDKTKQTQLFFVRVDVSGGTTTPAPGIAKPGGTVAPSERATRTP